MLEGCSTDARRMLEGCSSLAADRPTSRPGGESGRVEPQPEETRGGGPSRQPRMLHAPLELSAVTPARRRRPRAGGGTLHQDARGAPRRRPLERGERGPPPGRRERKRDGPQRHRPGRDELVHEAKHRGGHDVVFAGFSREGRQRSFRQFLRGWVLVPPVEPGEHAGPRLRPKTESPRSLRVPRNRGSAGPRFSGGSAATRPGPVSSDNETDPHRRMVNLSPERQRCRRVASASVGSSRPG